MNMKTATSRRIYDMRKLKNYGVRLQKKEKRTIRNEKI